ncbi:hypothetical protein FDB42_11985 [Clostridium botulinum]|nr:hypothetical protein [Clostridium botulinum]
MKNKKDEFEKFVAIFMFVLIFIATCIMSAFKFSQYGYLLEIKDYFNFASSFGGAILSALISMMILYITVKQTREIQQDNRRRQDIADSLTCIPMLDVNYSMNEENSHCGECENLKMRKYEYKNEESDTIELDIIGWILLDNIGKGPCNVKKHRIQYTYCDKIKTNYVTKWTDDFEDKSIKVESTEIITTNRNKLYQISISDNKVLNDYILSSIMVLELYYNDLLCNEYIQKFTLFCDDKVTEIKSVIVDLPKLIKD